MNMQQIEQALRIALREAWADGEQWGAQVAIRESEGSFVSNEAHERREAQAMDHALVHFQKVMGTRSDRKDDKSFCSPASTVYAEFERLQKQWHEETTLTSSSTDMILHPAYQRIIGLGPEVVPYLLAALQKEPDHWGWALEAITRENPVPKTSAGDLVAIAEAWLAWGRERCDREVVQILDQLGRDGAEHQEKTYPRQVMPKIEGQSFRCECGANVFTERRPLHYTCNGCGAQYEGEK